MEDGKMEDGKWIIGNGRRKMETGNKQLAIKQLPISSCQLTIDQLPITSDPIIN